MIRVWKAVCVTKITVRRALPLLIAVLISLPAWLFSAVPSYSQALPDGAVPCIPYGLWVEKMAPAYHLELVDASVLSDVLWRVEYWASKDRVYSAIIVVNDKGGACPARTLDLSGNLGKSL